MKKMTVLYLFFVLLSPYTQADSVDNDAPIILTDLQMDNVTAGRLGISVTALANAFGLNTIDKYRYL